MRKFSQSFKYAINGLKGVYKSQRNFRIQTSIGLITLFAAFILNLNGQQLLWISVAVMLVLIMEGLNTIIEVLMDLIHPEYHKSVKLIKDISAAMVLIASVFSVVIGVIIFGEAIFNLSPKYGIIIAIVFLILIKFFSIKGEPSNETNKSINSR